MAGDFAFTSHTTPHGGRLHRDPYEWSGESPPRGIVRDVSALTTERKDRAVAAVASRQYGVITRQQLLACGVSSSMIDVRLRRFWLHRLHRGAYAVGHTAPTPLQREMAAVLAAGRDAVLSHESAGYLWGLLDEPEGAAHVTLLARGCKRPGIASHHTRYLPQADRTVRWGIPVTTPARTVIDLAETLPEHDLEQMLAEARVMSLLNERQVRRALARARGRRGAGRLRAILNRAHGPALTRSQAEQRFLALVRAAQLPEPRVNTVVGGWEVDFCWPVDRLVVEIDGFTFHSSRRSFERDRARDAALAAQGFRVIRVTWRQLVDAPEAVIARLASALAIAA
jgi:very-short-patch-repair endonuclease